VDGYVPGAPPVVMTWHGGDASVSAPRVDDGRGGGVTAGTGTATPEGRVIGERLHQRRRLTAHEVGFLTKHATGPVKDDHAGASYVVSRGYKPGVTDRVYRSRREVLDDAACDRRCRGTSAG